MHKTRYKFSVTLPFISFQKKDSIPVLLMLLWHHLSLRRRWQFGLILVLILLVSFAELVSIGAVLPFLGMLTSSERITQLPYAQLVIQALGLTEPKEMLLIFTSIFGIAALTAGSMRILLLWVNTRFSYAAGAEISSSIYYRTLYQPYAVHCARNSSVIINGISNQTSAVIFIMNMFLTLVSSVVILVTILLVLISINTLVALVAFGVFAIIYIAIILLTRRQISINSEIMARESNQVIKALQEGLGGIRDILIDGTQSAFLKIYVNADLSLRLAQGTNFIISASPRYVMEALGMLSIAILAYILTQQVGGIISAIPMLGALALGAQRLIPILQQGYGAWLGIRSNKTHLKDTLQLLDQPMPSYAYESIIKPLPFHNNITLNNISFRYGDQSPYVIKSVNLKITKGSRVGFIGVSGGGKSTLLDIVMGLLEPTSGTLEIDGQALTSTNVRNWQFHIAHVPQAIFLADSTVEENIAFGIPKAQIDFERVQLVAKQAEISESIESWPNQYQTLVGERGICLSGGQRQRIGIARALYKKADVIIFDEATSALDEETERAVMLSIEGLSKNITMLIIAHRLTTLQGCTQIVEVEDGCLKSSRNV
jgi:ABC-type bacteriocin/lantibiotic exporter with double-glycine peptidase domain